MVTFCHFYVYGARFTTFMCDNKHKRSLKANSKCIGIIRKITVRLRRKRARECFKALPGGSLCVNGVTSLRLTSALFDLFARE